MSHLVLVHSLSPNCALSGCDPVSAFHGIGQKTAWTVWCRMPNLATVFSRLDHAPSQVSPDALNEIEIYCMLFSCINEHQHSAM